MSVKAIPEGYCGVTPYLSISGAAEAIEFYKRAFSADELFRLAAPSGNIMHAEIKIGDSLEFTFKLKNRSSIPIKIRLEYGLYYQKANGTLTRKVYKISEKTYEENSITAINRKQSFKQITTRKFHKGLHKLSLIINGNEIGILEFQLI